MKEGWEIKKLGEICENLDSKRIPITKDKRISGEFPYYGASGIVDYLADYIFDEELLLVSEDGAKKSRFVDIASDFILSIMSFGRPYIMESARLHS